MLVENGLYIGDLSPIVAWYEKITSSTVTGLPSWQVMPERSTTSSVVGSAHVTVFAAQGCGRPSGPMRIRRSQTRSVTQLSGEPEI